MDQAAMNKILSMIYGMGMGSVVIPKDCAFLPGIENDLGIGNRLTLLDDEILKNIGQI